MFLASTSETDSMSPLDIRIEELRHHMKIEAAVHEGSKNAIKLLQMTGQKDKKALSEVGRHEEEEEEEEEEEDG